MPMIMLDNLNVSYHIDGQGVPLLFIHGLGSSSRDWENQLPFFQDHYQIITYDLRGHGKTDKPKAPYTIPLFANDAAQLCQALVQQPIHVIGHSLGGMISFQLALDFPDLVRSLTIINSAPAVIFPSFLTQLSFLLRRFSVKLFGMRHLSKNLANHLFPKPEQQPMRDVFISRWLENDPHAYINTLKAFKGWNVMPRLSSLQCPTLIMTADDDYTPVAFKEYYTKLIPQAELIVIKDSKHLSPIDQPMAVNQALFQFLTKQNH